MLLSKGHSLKAVSRRLGHANPTMTLVRSSDGAAIASNDDWQSQDAASVSAIQSSGFQPNESIVTNALPHVGRAVVVRLDLRDFFPSTTSRRVYHYFRRIGWNRPAGCG